MYAIFKYITNAIKKTNHFTAVKIN